MDRETSKLFSLPAELWLEVASNIQDESVNQVVRTLYALSLTSRMHYAICQPLLYRSVLVKTPQAAKLLKRILANPILGTLIQDFIIDWSEDHQAWYDHTLSRSERENPTSYWDDTEWSHLTKLTENLELSTGCMLDLRRGRSFASMLIVFLQLLPNLQCLSLDNVPSRGMYEENCFVFKYVGRLIGAEWNPDEYVPLAKHTPVGLKNITTFSYSGDLKEPDLDIRTIYPWVLAPKLVSLTIVNANITQTLDASWQGTEAPNLTHIHFKNSDVEFESLLNLVEACSRIEHFSYEYRFMFEVFQVDFDCRKIVEALRAHKDTLTFLRLTDDTPSGSKFSGDPLTTGTGSLTDFKQLKHLDIDLKLLEPSPPYPYESSVQLLPPNLVTLTVNTDVNVNRETSYYRGLWDKLEKELMDVRQNAFLNLTTIVLGKDRRHVERPAKFIFHA